MKTYYINKWSFEIFTKQIWVRNGTFSALGSFGFRWTRGLAIGGLVDVTGAVKVAYFQLKLKFALNCKQLVHYDFKQN